MLVQDMRSTAPDGTTVATRRNVHESSGRNHMSRASFYRHWQATQMSGHTVDCRNHVLREIKDELKEMKILKRSAPAA
jgi:hypothetical protein